MNADTHPLIILVRSTTLTVITKCNHKKSYNERPIIMIWIVDLTMQRRKRSSVTVTLYVYYK